MFSKRKFLKPFGSFQAFEKGWEFFPIYRLFVSCMYYIYPELRISYAGFELGKGVARENKRATKTVLGNHEGGRGMYNRRSLFWLLRRRYRVNAS